MRQRATPTLAAEERARKEEKEEEEAGRGRGNTREGVMRGGKGKELESKVGRNEGVA